MEVDAVAGMSSGGSADSTMCGMADPISIPDLIAKLEELAAMRGVDKVRLARELSDVAMASLQAVGDEGVWQATREAPYAEVARELGYSTQGPVRRAVYRHGKRATEGSQVRRPRARKIVE